MKIYNPTGFSSSLTGSFSGSVKGTFEGSFSGGTLNSISGAFTQDSSSFASRIDDLETFEANIDSTYATDVQLSTAVSGLNAATSSYLKNTTDTLTGDLTVTGTITAQEFHTEFVSASIIYQSGSTQFGNSGDDTHIFSGNVGIGTSTTHAALHIYGGIDSAPTGDGIMMGLENGYSAIHLNGQNGSYIDFSTGSIDRKGRIIYFNSTDQMRLQTSGSDRIIIDSDGVVGIGTTAEVYGADRLNIKGSHKLISSSPGGNLAIFTSDTQAADKGGSIVLGGTYTGTIAYQFAGIAGLKENSTAGNAAGYLAFYSTDSGNSTPERMRIDSLGRVGIGTNNPSTKLDISGTGTVTKLHSDTTYVDMLMENSAITGYLNLNSNSMNLYVGGGSAGDIKMKLLTNGSVGIGTATPNESLTVNGNIETLDTFILNNGTIKWQEYLNSNEFTLRYNNGSWNEYLRVDVDGNVGIGTNNPGRLLHVNGIIQWGGGSTAPYHYSGIDSGGVYFEQVDNNTGKGKMRFQTRTNNTGAYTSFVINADNGRFEFNNGSVGIGTTSPTQKLHVEGSILSQQTNTVSFGSLTGSSGDWFPIAQIGDNTSATCMFHVRTYAHSSILFNASEGYSLSNYGHIQVLDHVYGANSGYANVAGVRIRQNGVIEIKLNWSSGPSVDVQVTAFGVRRPTLYSSLATTTETSTITDTVEVDGSRGMMRAIGNISAQGSVSTASNVLADSDIYTKQGLRFNGTGLNATDKKLYSSSDGCLEWFTHNFAGTPAFAVSHQGSKQVLLNVYGDSYLNGGNVGIGRTSPAYKLDADGPIRAGRLTKHVYYYGTTANVNNQYFHIKTNVSTASASMHMWHVEGYAYGSTAVLDERFGYHTDSTGNVYRKSYTGTYANNIYTSSDNYVVLVFGPINTYYTSFAINLFEGMYTPLGSQVTAATYTSSNSGAY